MTAFLLIKYLHFLGIFGVVGTLCTEQLMIRRQMSRKELGRLAKIDGVYGASTILVLAAGFLMWFAVGKPAAFYSTNWIFIAKLAVFGVIGALSIVPTVFFIKNRKGDPGDTVEVPGKVLAMIKLEFVLLLILPLLAVLMANGIGG